MVLTSTLGTEIARERGRFYYMEKLHKAEFYVINMPIATENVVIHEVLNHEAASYSELPFTAVLKGMKYDIDWSDDYTAKVTKDDKKYILNLNEITFTKENDSENLIPLMLGGTNVRKISEKEIILDSATINYALKKMNENFYIGENCVEKRVFLINKEIREDKVVTTVTETDPVVTTTTEMAVPKAVDLNLTEEEEWSFNNRSKFIYFTEDGCYYPVEIGGRQSANYVLCFEDLNGNQTIFEETEDSAWHYFDENVVYMFKHDWRKDWDKYGYYKLENGELKLLKEETNGRNACYFMEDYIYYKLETEDSISICRMDYNMENSETVIEFDSNEYYLYGFLICDDKIWYSYCDDGNKKDCPCHHAWYNMNTGETKELKSELKLGRINNGYMYYICGVKNDTLNRFNMKTGKVERILDDLEWLYNSMYDFYEDYILYTCDDKLYKYDGKESEVICTPDDVHPDESFWLGGVQCQNGRIFIEIGSGAFYEEIVEIDIEGNVLNIIPEKKK